MMAKNYCINFVKRPGVNGTPQEDNFLYTECEYPVVSQSGEVAVKTLYLSVDPAQRCQMNEETGAEYLQPLQLGEVVNGLLGIGVVIESAVNEFKVGDIVINSISGGLGWPWKLYFKTPEANKKLTIVQVEDPKFELTYYGMPGLTSLIGMQEKGHIHDNNGSGKCVVVSGAAGSCGHLAGQFALINGCSPVIGICGSDEKCGVLTEQLKFTGAINYKTENVEEKLKSLCSSGVDVYFDNVGGLISDTVISNMNRNGHVVLCGQISQYNKDVEYPPPLAEDVKAFLSKMNITRDRFLVLMYMEKFEEARKELYSLKRNQKIKILENVYDGLELTGKAFCDMMNGRNIGKQIIHVADL